MKNVDEVYLDAMNEIQGYDIEAVFDKIVGSANKSVSRRIEEYDIVFENVAKNSIGEEKKVKKTCVLNKMLSLFVACAVIFSMAGCSKDKPAEPIDEISIGSYDDMMNRTIHEFYSEAYSLGNRIGNEFALKNQEAYYQGENKTVTDEDIIFAISRVVSGDDWYENIGVYLSDLAVNEVDNYETRYSIASTIYDGIIESLSYQDIKPNDFELFIEKIIGKEVVLEVCEHFDEIVYNKVNRELTEEEKFNNILILAKYYDQIMTNQVEDVTLSLK